jgi:hypothetical protein
MVGALGEDVDELVPEGLIQQLLTQDKVGVVVDGALIAGPAYGEIVVLVRNHSGSPFSHSAERI